MLLDQLRVAGATSCLLCSSPAASRSFQPGVTGLATDACPWICAAGLYSPTADADGASGAQGCFPCANAPAWAAYTGPGSASGICPWQCMAGSYLSSGACQQCPTGTYSAAAGLRRNFASADEKSKSRFQAIYLKGPSQSAAVSCIVSPSPSTVDLKQVQRHTAQCLLSCHEYVSIRPYLYLRFIHSHSLACVAAHLSINFHESEFHTSNDTIKFTR